jgi:hypothetical protein
MMHPEPAPPVLIRRQDPGDDFAASTLCRLVTDAINSTLYEHTESYLVGLTKLFLRHAQSMGVRSIFANPRGSVRCREPTEDFLRSAFNAQQGWLRTLRDVFGQRGLDRIAQELRSQPLLWQLQFTGIMIIDGKHVFPNEWAKRLRQGRRH